MLISWNGIATGLAMLLVAWLPLPRRAEGVRIGFFGAAMAYVFFSAIRGAGNGELRPAAESKPLVAIPIELPPVTDDNRLGGVELLTGFSILRYLRRTGAVSDTEYEAKKAELLHRA